MLIIHSLSFISQYLRVLSRKNTAVLQYPWYYLAKIQLSCNTLSIILQKYNFPPKRRRKNPEILKSFLPLSEASCQPPSPAWRPPRLPPASWRVPPDSWRVPLDSWRVPLESWRVSRLMRIVRYSHPHRPILTSASADTHVDTVRYSSTMVVGRLLNVMSDNGLCHCCENRRKWHIPRYGCQPPAHGWRRRVCPYPSRRQAHG